MIDLDLARLLLCDRFILDELASWAREDGASRLKPWSREKCRFHLETRLLTALRRTAHDRLAGAHYHHVALHVEHWEHRRDGVLDSTSSEAPGSPWPGTAQQRHSSLLEASLARLSEALLCEEQGRIALRWEALPAAQRILRHIDASQLCAFAMAQKRAHSRRFGQPLAADECQLWARDAVIPPIANSSVTELGRRGLVEVHRHMNVSMQPLFLWSELMGRDRLPNQLAGRTRALVRRGQALRSALRKGLRERSRDRQDPASPENRLSHWTSRLDQAMASTGEEPGFSSLCSPAVLDTPTVVAGAVGERVFLCELFEWLRETGSERVRAAIHAYCLLQNLVLGELVMRLDSSSGLDRFVDHFSGHSIRDALERGGPHGLVQAYRTGRVFWLEARFTPKKARERIDQLLASCRERRATARRGAACMSTPVEPDVLRPDHSASLPALGVVFHFVKQHVNTMARARGREGCLRKGPRDHELRYKAWQQADALAELLQRNPRYAGLILGFDVCGSEASTSMGTFASHLRYLRGLRRARSTRVGRLLPESAYEHLQPRLTCHAGEDFGHLLTGLRHIDEAIEFYDLRAGDRLGHALALGVSPESWSARIGPRCIVRQGEWLDDLVWFHQWLARVGGHDSVRHATSVEASRFARRIYGAERKEIALDIGLLWSAWLLRAEDPLDCSGLEQMKHPDLLLLGGRRYARESLASRLSSPELPIPAWQLWWDYHTHTDVRERWEETSLVEVNPHWGAAIRAVQRALTRKVVEKRLVIEVNPSSNLTLGPFEALTEHPIFQWLNPKEELTGQLGPLVTVGSDDPSAFGTELLHEYAFLARAAEELGASQRQVQTWLEHLREAGIRYSFFPRDSFVDPSVAGTPGKSHCSRGDR